ncbi:MAG: hypothetical protein AAGJ18_14445 [Bacteroidota bacterium]
MDVLSIKNDLLRLMVETDDAVLLDSVRNYFKKLKKEPLTREEIEEQERKMIELGLTQLQTGSVMSHEEARAKIETNLNKKQR